MLVSRGFAQTPHVVMLSDKLTDAERRTWYTLYMCAMQKDYSYPKPETIAELLNLDKRYVKQAIKKLSRLGLIAIEQDAKGRPIYRLLPIPTSFSGLDEVIELPVHKRQSAKQAQGRKRPTAQAQEATTSGGGIIVTNDEWERRQQKRNGLGEEAKPQAQPTAPMITAEQVRAEAERQRAKEAEEARRAEAQRKQDRLRELERGWYTRWPGRFEAIGQDAESACGYCLWGKLATLPYEELTEEALDRITQEYYRECYQEMKHLEAESDQPREEATQQQETQATVPDVNGLINRLKGRKAMLPAQKQSTDAANIRALTAH